MGVITISWDDTQTSTDDISYSEWNNMVTYIKSHAGWKLYTSGSTGAVSSGTTVTIASSLPVKKIWKLVLWGEPSGDSARPDLRLNGITSGSYSRVYISDTTIYHYTEQDRFYSGDTGGGTNRWVTYMFTGKNGGDHLFIRNAQDSGGTCSSSMIQLEGCVSTTDDLSSVQIVVDGGYTDLKYALYYQDDIESL